MQLTQRILLVTLFLLAISLPLSGGQHPDATANADFFGWATIIPPLLAIVLAFLTRNVLASLFLGAFSGVLLLVFKKFTLAALLPQSFLAITGQLQKVIADPWNAGIILQCLTIGGLIALISKSGGAAAVTRKLAARAGTAVRAQLATWLMGLLVFFDDYANALIIGPVMRPVTDKLRISRERLAFIIDATAAPIAGIALVSTWVAYELGLIRSAFETIGVTKNAYAVFLETIPYRFYNIFILGFVFLSSLMDRNFGPMLKAEQRSRSTGQVLGENAKPMVGKDTTAVQEADPAHSTPWLMIIPLLVLLGTAFAGFYWNGYSAIMAGSDTTLQTVVGESPLSFTALQACFGKADASIVLFQAAFLASLTALGMIIWKKILKAEEALETWLGGVRSLLSTALVLVLAWTLTGVIKEIGTASFLTGILEGNLPGFLLPTLIFVLGAIISFATGTSYGTMGILMPLAVPLTWALSSQNMEITIMATGAVLTGAIFGDHCSPISDTTILSSTGAASDHIDHTKTQLPYAIIMGIFAILIGYLPAGLGIPVWFLLPIGIALTWLLLQLFGKQ